MGVLAEFSYVIKKAMKKNYKYIWIMDDDLNPENKALELLENKSNLINDKFSYMASLLYWTDGNLFPMNIPNAKSIFGF